MHLKLEKSVCAGSRTFIRVGCISQDLPKLLPVKFYSYSTMIFLWSYCCKITAVEMDSGYTLAQRWHGHVIAVAQTYQPGLSFIWID